MKRTVLSIVILSVASSGMSQEQLPMQLRYNAPAVFFEEAIPIGNGKIGAMVYGGTDNDSLQLNDITLWSGKPVYREADRNAYEWIPQIREALFKEDYQTADKLQLNVQGPNSQYYMPLGTLYLRDLNGSSQVSDYRRALDLDSAICRTTYIKEGVTYTKEYFASHPDKLIAIHLKASKPRRLAYSVSLASLLQHQTTASDGQIIMTGNATGDSAETTHFCTIARIVAHDGEVTAARNEISIKGATEATIYLTDETSFNSFDKHPVKEGAPYVDNAKANLQRASKLNYGQLLSRHVKDYRNLFCRLKLNIGGSKDDRTLTTEQQLKDYTDKNTGNKYLETLYFQFGRYLLISCSRTPNVPANLQGLWNPYLKAPWRSNYTVNINLEENYWPAEVANLSEMAEPLFGLIKEMSVNGKYAARNYYGINRGWCAGHNSDVWAKTNPVGEKTGKPEWSDWNLGGAWLTQALWEHYAFTQDMKFLRETAYPLMKGASEFMLDWLIDNPKKPGELITAPSTSPENEYKTDKGYHGMTCYGGTADLAIIRELFNNTLSAASIISAKDGEFTSCLKDALGKLHPYAIGHMGDINEWYYDWDDWDFQHRHQSHLIGLYPGHQITPLKTPELAKAAARSLEIKGDKTTGWSTGWRINLWARLRNGKQAYHIYQKLLTYVSPDKYKGPDRRSSGGTYPNLFDAHSPFQIDGNFGGVAGVCEMLVQSGDGIELLPALPDEWKSGSVKGICARGGYVIDMSWKDGKVTAAAITSKVGGSVDVKYNGLTKTLKLKKGQTKKL